MTTLPTPSAGVRSRPALSSGLLAAHRLRSLTSSLAVGWESLDAATRMELIGRIQQVADELASTERIPPLEATSGGDEAFRFLTAREFQVLHALADGASTLEIGQRLGLSVSTVRSYIKSVLAKLGAHSRLEAVTMLLARESTRPWLEGDGSAARRSG
jgi:DNA-binding NarL/FixJ family response regulator